MAPTQSFAPTGSRAGDARSADKIDPTRAAAGAARWRRALADALGEDPGARLDQPDRRLAMLRVFGSTRRLADLCLKHPAAAAEALIEGASSVLAQAARDLTALNGGVGGADALYGALSPLKCRADLAIAIAELTGAWTPSEATAARADFAERLIDVSLTWLVRGGVNRGELGAQKDDGPAAGVFALAGGDFAHEDLAPYGPLEVAIIYDEAAFPGPAARMAERAFVRIGAELREAFEGKPGDYPLFSLKTPFGSAVSGAGLTESKSRANAAINDPPQSDIRAWIATARVVAGDRRAGGAFLEDAEQAAWKDSASFGPVDAPPFAARDDDPRTPFRNIANMFRYRLGASRPVFRTASARVVIETAAKSRVLPHDVASRLIVGEEFAQALVSRAQMMRGAIAFGASRADEEAALADLCGFADYKALDAVLSGFTADAANTAARVAKGPLLEFERYRAAGENVDDVDKLEDLGFNDGAGLSGIVDRWANLVGAGGEASRFSAVAPGLLTAFGETQHPDDAVKLFDDIIRNASKSDEALAKIAAEGGVRDGLVDALGCFGDAVAPLAETGALADEFFHERGKEIPESGAEWLARFVPPGAKASLSDLAAWRRASIARIALYSAAGDMAFDAAAGALEAVSGAALNVALGVVQRELKTGDGLALHVFDGPGRGLPGSATFFGFIASNGEPEQNETAARRFVDALDELGDGVFAIAPDVSHRPGGVAGGLAPDIAAFKSYVQSEAIAYDQIMLARARVIAGTEAAQAAARSALRTGVANPKRADILFRDLDRARAQRLRRDKATSEWDLDQAEGGLHDVELIISTLIYRHAAAQPSIQDGDINAALDTLARASVIPPGVADTLKSARAFWTRLATARALARWSDPGREPVRSRFAALLARAAEVERFAQVRPIMRGYADEVGRLYAQLVLGRPSLSLVSNA